jgi:hypothetical protein
MSNDSKTVNELITTCAALEAYHTQVGRSYQEIVFYLENLQATKLTSEDSITLVNLIALPLINIFKKMDEDKPGSPEYIYKLICHAYMTHKPID